MSSASAKVVTKPLDSCSSCREEPAKSKLYPDGSERAAIAFNSASALPSDTPGMAMPATVEELSCWKWLIDCGAVFISIEATVESGTEVPSAARM